MSVTKSLVSVDINDTIIDVPVYYLNNRYYIYVSNVWKIINRKISIADNTLRKRIRKYKINTKCPDEIIIHQRYNENTQALHTFVSSLNIRQILNWYFISSKVDYIIKCLENGNNNNDCAVKAEIPPPPSPPNTLVTDISHMLDQHHAKLQTLMQRETVIDYVKSDAFEKEIQIHIAARLDIEQKKIDLKRKRLENDYHRLGESLKSEILNWKSAREEDLLTWVDTEVKRVKDTKIIKINE